MAEQPKKLNEQQIEKLFVFTREHFVEWYDLQCELIDHLANDIEAIWVERPQLSFDEAKQESFKKFGIFGFMDVVEKKRGALDKRYRKMIWLEYVKYFKIPKIVLTIAAIIGLIFIFRWVNHNVIFIGFLGLFIIILPFIIAFKYHNQIKNRQESSGIKYMFEESIANIGGLLFLPYIFINTFIQFIDKINWNLTTEIILSSIIILTSLFIYISYKIIPPKVAQILKKEHPEYALP